MNRLLTDAAYTLCSSTYLVTLPRLQRVSHLGTLLSATGVGKTFWRLEGGLDSYANTGSSPFCSTQTKVEMESSCLGSQFRWQMSAWHQLTFILISMKGRFIESDASKCWAQTKHAADSLVLKNYCYVSLSVLVLSPSWYGFMECRCWGTVTCMSNNGMMHNVLYCISMLVNQESNRIHKSYFYKCFL